MAYGLINKSGSEVWHGGLVKVRFDLFLEPDDARYDERYTYVPVIPEGGYTGKVDEDGRPIDQKDYDLWLASLSHIWQLAPFHSHFLRFEPDVSQEQVEAAILPHIPNFYKAWTEEWDKVPGGMRHGWDVATRTPRPRRYDKEFTIPELGTRPTECFDKLGLILASNLSVRTKDIGEIFPATAIDIGGAAVPRSGRSLVSWTRLEGSNTANDTGSLDTVEIYANEDLANAEVATFIPEGSDTFSSRDFGAIGAVVSGAKRAFTGKDISVATGDVIGIYGTSGYIESGLSGGGTGWHQSGDQIPCTSVTFSTSTYRPLSLYATGETPVAPTVTTQAVDDILSTTATGNGNITATGGANADHRGVVYGKTSKGDPGDTSYTATDYDGYVDESGDFGTGAFDRSLTSLDADTTYYVRAYAHNSAGYSYGAEVNFDTLEIQTINNITGIATVEGVGGPQVDLHIQSITGIGTVEGIGGPQANLHIQSISGIATVEGIGGPVVIAGIVGAGGIATVEGIGSSILAGPIIASGVATIQGIGGPQVNLHIQSISGIATVEGLGAPVIAGSIIVSGIATLEGVGGPQVNLHIQGITGIATVEGLGAVVVAGPILATGIATVEGLGAVIVAGPIIATPVISVEGVGNPQVNLWILLPSGIGTVEGLGSPQVNMWIHAGSVASVEGIGSPQVNLWIHATGVDSVEGLGTPFLTTYATLAAALGYTVEVRDSSDKLVSILHKAYEIGLVEELNRPPMLDFMVLADSDTLTNINRDNQIWLRDYDTGTLLYKFILSRRRDVRD